MSPRSYSTSRSRGTNFRPFVAFILVAMFGILFAGCSSKSDEYVFTEDDSARFQDLARTAEQEVIGATSSGAVQSTPTVEALPSGSGAAKSGGPVVLDLSQVPAFNAIRANSAAGDSFRVTNTFLNVRDTPSTGGKNLGQLNYGDAVQVLEFIDATWAKVKAVQGGTEGYAAQRYLAKVTTEDKLAAEKKAFEGQYYVNFAFVNVRKSADQGSEKVGEIPGQAIVKPDTIANGWAKVSYKGISGYVSTNYLAPFVPNFLVRQDKYQLPVLHYNLASAGALEALKAHVPKLKEAGVRFETFRTLSELLLAQQQRDARLAPGGTIIAVSGITAGNVKEASDALAGTPATFFIATKNVGMTGITEKMLLTLMANGIDIQSGGHTGDDLRGLTNDQADLELKQSRKMLEDITHKTVLAVAYPKGGVNDRVQQLAAGLGYLMGLTNTPEKSFTRQQLLMMPSLEIFSNMTGEDVVNLVKTTATDEL